MNHQEAKDLLSKVLPDDSLNLVKVELFRLSWEGKGYNIVAEETGYDHDYIRKAGSQLWKELSGALDTNITKRNFRPHLEERLASSSTDRKRTLEYPGGVMQFSSPFYVERTEAENQAYAEILRPGAVIRIKGPRKTGKSSLMLRVLDQAESEGFKVVTIDLLLADHNLLSDLDRLLRWICLNICAQLSIDEDPGEHWNELIGSKLSCTNFIQQQVLSKLDAPLVLVINELNRIFDYEDVSRDFLPLLRSWFEEAKHNEVMARLKQVLIYSSEVYVQLDMNLSPFNVGLPVELKPFDGEQLEALSSVYGFNWKADGTANSPITSLLTELGGHPYLCQLALYHLASQEGFIESPSAALRSLLDSATDAGGIFSDFLEQLQEDLASNETAVAGFRKIYGEDTAEPSRIEVYQLERLGLVQIRDGQPVPTSRLLSDYLLTQI